MSPFDISFCKEKHFAFQIFAVMFFPHFDLLFAEPVFGRLFPLENRYPD